MADIRNVKQRKNTALNLRKKLTLLIRYPKGYQYIDDLIILRMDRINKINNEIKHLETVCDEIECSIDDYSAERIMRLRC